eukprot:12421942-Karenia_brevis.AAC.1
MNYSFPPPPPMDSDQIIPKGRGRHRDWRYEEEGTQAMASAPRPHTPPNQPAQQLNQQQINLPKSPPLESTGPAT